MVLCFQWTQPWSLLNRFMILPDGVDSKKLSLLRNIENSIELCKYLTALTNINVWVISFASEKKPKIKKNKLS